MLSLSHPQLKVRLAIRLEVRARERMRSVRLGRPAYESCSWQVLPHVDSSPCAIASGSSNVICMTTASIIISTCGSFSQFGKR